MAHAFDPDIQATREESRCTQQFETLQLQHLVTQVQECEAETHDLRHQLYNLQHELDWESRHVDGAEHEVRMLELMGWQVHTRSS